MTNINDSYLLSVATTAAKVVFVLFIISLFVVGSMTGVYLCVCTVFHVSLRVHLSLYIYSTYYSRFFLILTPRETLSLFSFPLSTLLHFKNFKKITKFSWKFSPNSNKKNWRVSKSSLIGLGLTVVWLNRWPLGDWTAEILWFGQTWLKAQLLKKLKTGEKIWFRFFNEKEKSLKYNKRHLNTLTKIGVSLTTINMTHYLWPHCQKSGHKGRPSVNLTSSLV